MYNVANLPKILRKIHWKLDYWSNCTLRVFFCDIIATFHSPYAHRALQDMWSRNRPLAPVTSRGDYECRSCRLPAIRIVIPSRNLAIRAAAIEHFSNRVWFEYSLKQKFCYSIHWSRSS